MLAVLLSVAVACNKDELKDVVKHATGENTPTMVTKNVTTLISDSGITQYRITTPLWLMYEQAEAPFWNFPDGIKLEEFDLKFKVAASVRCDSAIYYKVKQLWELNGNVRIQNIRQELILTNQLFWDQRNQEIYSDSFIHIEQPSRVLEGYGFKSNERLTTYNINQVSGIFPVEEKKTK